LFYKPIDEICHPHGNIHNYEDFINENIDCSFCKDKQEEKRKEIEKLKKIENKKNKNIKKNLNVIQLIGKGNKEELRIKQQQNFKDFLEKRIKYHNDLVRFYLIFEFEKQKNKQTRGYCI
jgi:aspartokinase